MIDDLLKKQDFSLLDIEKLLQIDVTSKDFYTLIAYANTYARNTFTKGYVFMQIGLNAEPCSGNCRFCCMAKDNFLPRSTWSMSEQELIAKLQNIPDFVSDVFLMTTADYSKNQFLKMCKLARKILPSTTRLVANFADFDLSFATQLKKVGVSACYHIRRLNEGIDTDIPISTRENTINAIKTAGMELYYCIEPIGKEHSICDIAKEIYYAKEQQVDVMAVMRRVSVNDNFCKDKTDISLLEITKIVAVALLCVKPTRSMNVHEPNAMSLLAGVNQLYAEEGGNPRDTTLDTKKGRGISAIKAKKMLKEALWQV